MTYDLLIGDRSYSSWSLRGWLLFEAFGLPFTEHRTLMYTEGFKADAARWGCGRTVPQVRTPEGGLWTDSLAIAEGLAEAFPNAGLWPADPVARATARSITCEMHAGFTALRSACAMNLRIKSGGFRMTEAVQKDLDRLEVLWGTARSMAGDGPWLFGAYSAADAFYAPVAMRIAGYGLPVSEAAQAYVAAHLNHLPLRRWRAMGEAQNRTLDVYTVHEPAERFPMPDPLPARAVDGGPSVNDCCPYSGEPVTAFLELDGKTWGFCNAFCRDKTLADPAAWPAFTSMVDAAR